MTQSIPGSFLAVEPNPEIVSRATALVPMIREYANQGAEGRRVAPEVIKELDRADLFRLFLPARLGGLEASAATIFETLAEVSRGDGSTGWVTTLLSSAAGYVSTFPDQAQHDIFGANPRARVSGTFAPTTQVERVEGGYLVSGRWPYSSGSFAADWLTLGLLIPRENPDENPVSMALFPRDACRIEPSWFVTGLTGTGSDTVVVDNQFVPDHRIQPMHNMLDGEWLTSHKEDRVAGWPFSSLVSVILAAPQLGLARHALEITRAKLGDKRVTNTAYRQARLSPTHQLNVADAATKLHLAELAMRRVAHDIDTASAERRRPDVETRARIRNDTGVIADLCKESIGLLLTANGSGSFAESNVLSRIWRDSEIANRHAHVTSGIGREAYGRILLGNHDNLIEL
ncbi:oxidoreductase [Streptomyces sp. NBC_00120]|uniref:oxidoreductase n=1 Tax=Streptomyces sp. NBC_00120 TaxID=2975660 RepID=UPI0022550B0E|nr:oxidoreductase [Streptomyces sp. NBC_00120]MCX5326893.1 oxidoreductase [Streptomyces sp. NBC_00120]